jgi:NAD-specific glutamate dehydrogenase
MISKYAIFEQLYLQNQMQATHLFRTALVRLYASILSFLAEAKYYYAERTGIRVVKSTFQIGLSKMAKLKQEIQDEQVAVVEIARLIDVENLRVLNGDIKSMPSELKNMRNALDQLSSPMQNANDQLEGIVNRLERMQISDLLGWISNMPYTQHHETVRSGRLENSGLWLFDQSEYIDWRKSQSSSLLWLHGMRGFPRFLRL